MRSTRWKQLERDAARALGGVRVPRWLDFGQSAPDVEVRDFGLIIDCKARKAFSHHSLIHNIVNKYCEPGEVPCLITKSDRQRGEYVTIPLDFLGNLLNQLRANARENPPDAGIEQCRNGADASVNANVNSVSTRKHASAVQALLR